jgi:hypothetical protein
MWMRMDHEKRSPVVAPGRRRKARAVAPLGERLERVALGVWDQKRQENRTKCAEWGSRLSSVRRTLPEDQ